MQIMKFNIFGTLVGVSRSDGKSGWRAFYLGDEGKRRPADFIVPDDIAEDDICEYLADLFHENATPRNSQTRKLD